MMEEQENDCKLILNGDAFFIVSEHSDFVWMWDKDGMWYSTDGIDGPFVSFDLMEKISEAILFGMEEGNDGRLLHN